MTLFGLGIRIYESCSALGGVLTFPQVILGDPGLGLKLGLRCGDRDGPHRLGGVVRSGTTSPLWGGADRRPGSDVGTFLVRVSAFKFFV